VIRRFKAHARKLLTPLLKEGLGPGRAAAAVFFGIFIGIVPIYGFQTLAAVGVALLFRLNKPLTVAGTFVSNPLLQPLIIFSSVELGCLLRLGSFQPLTLSALSGARTHLNLSKEQVFIFAIGSVALGVLLGGVGAAITAVVVHRRRDSNNSALQDRARLEPECLPEAHEQLAVSSNGSSTGRPSKPSGLWKIR
jgi:uncharacterized protein (DUF2062 family)